MKQTFPQQLKYLGNETWNQRKEEKEANYKCSLQFLIEHLDNAFFVKKSCLGFLSFISWSVNLIFTLKCPSLVSENH